MVESGRVQYDRLPVPDSDLRELDDAPLREYFNQVRRLQYPDDADERARLLVNLGFATQHAGRVVPTVAGLLLFGVRPQDRLPAATLKCAFFYGLHQGTQLRDRADVEGSLHRVIDDGRPSSPATAAWCPGWRASGGSTSRSTQTTACARRSPTRSPTATGRSKGRRCAYLCSTT